VNVSVAVAAPRWTTSDRFLCWNLDGSRNRQFFERNLSQHGAFGRQLAAGAAALGDAQAAGTSVLRFGGTGNDYLTCVVLSPLLFETTRSRAEYGGDDSVLCHERAARSRPVVLPLPLSCSLILSLPLLPPSRTPAASRFLPFHVAEGTP